MPKHIFFIDCLDTVFNEHKRKLSEFGHVDVPDDVYLRKMKLIGYDQWFENMPRNEYFLKILKLMTNHHVSCIVPREFPNFWDIFSPVSRAIRSNLRMLLSNLTVLPSSIDYARENHVLISRNQELIEQWVARGGIGIRYKNATQTYNQVYTLVENG